MIEAGDRSDGLPLGRQGQLRSAGHPAVAEGERAGAASSLSSRCTSTRRSRAIPADILPNYLTTLGIPFHIERQDTHSIVKRVIPEGKTMCSLCSRLRRGVIYRVATELGATKIALGHHREDMLETLFLNMFHGGKLKGMPPKLVSDDGRHVVIRPLAYASERDLARYADQRAFPIIPCNLCGSQPNLQRQAIKQMLQAWEKQHPGRIETMFRALQNVVPSHLADTSLYDFAGLKPTGIPDPDGDTAFDPTEFDDEDCAPAADERPTLAPISFVERTP
jgi:tRNA 2-thiocytidine biosynthesis protein TtcA